MLRPIDRMEVGCADITGRPEINRPKNDRFKIQCGHCGTIFYTHQEANGTCGRAAEHSRDNTFCCYNCTRNYDTAL
jgi:hypothetical protein